MRSVPATIHVGPYDIAVVVDDSACDAEMATNGENLHGFFKFSETRITLRKMTPAATREVLLHEVLHAVMAHIGFASQATKDEEAIVGRVAPTLLDVLRDNPGLVLYLTK